MSENKTSKYFKYAIGEILLVVIGILVALSINNWNETKKDHNYEAKMLAEINKTLEADLEHFERMSSRLFKLDSASTHFIKLVHKKTVFNDTLYKAGFSRWYFLRTGINFQYNRGPYDALKSSGLDKVSNDSLRNSLIDYYDSRLPKYEALIMHSEREYNDDVTVLESFLDEPFTELENGEVNVYSKFPEDLLLKVEFLVLLRNINTRSKISQIYIDQIIPHMKNLYQQIKNDLEK